MTRREESDEGAEPAVKGEAEAQAQGSWRPRTRVLSEAVVAVIPEPVPAEGAAEGRADDGAGA